MSIQDPRFQKFLAASGLKSNPEDVRNEPLFDSLSERIRLVERQGPTAIIWADLARDALELLCEQSRDFSVVCWGAVGLARSEGASGLALGLAMVKHMVEVEWEGIFPPIQRMRQRRGSIVWLVTQLARVLPQSLVDRAQNESLQLAASEGSSLDVAIGEKMPDAPSLRELLTPLKALAREMAEQQSSSATDTKEAAVSDAQEAAPDQTEQEDSPAQNAVDDKTPQSVQPVINPPSPATPGGQSVKPDMAPLNAPDMADYDATHDNVVSRCQTTTRALALAFLERNPADWRAYTLLGAITWLAVTDLPAADAKGQTLLMLPSQTRRDDIAAIEAAGNGQEVVVALAQVLSASGLFWFDGYFKLYRALHSLAASDAKGAWKTCADIVTGNVRAFIRRMPEVLNFSFQDGTPFASGMARSWLLPAEQAAGAPTVAPQDAGADASAQRARALLEEGDEDGAFALLAEHARTGEGGRERFKARLLLSRLCLDVGQYVVAAAMLDVLKAEADAKALSAWEPQMWSELNRQRYRCAVMAPPQVETSSEKAATQALTALALTDPVDAIRLARDRETHKK